jgi:2-oxoglutarate dehydrogenase E2 component (dihydrolipoamide succinyltransferase)
MPIELTVPEVGESISEVQIGEWFKNEGDYVERNEELVVIETDKATVELPAPGSGKITKILKKTGDTASVHEVIGYLDTAASDSEEPSKKHSARTLDQPNREDLEQQDSKKTPQEKTADTKESYKKPTETRAGEKNQAGGEAKSKKAEEKEAPTTLENNPAVEKEERDSRPVSVESRAPEQSQIEATRNRLRLRQVDRTIQRATPDLTPTRERMEPSSQREFREPLEERAEKAVPMTHLRRRIAERLVQAQQTAALLTTFNEIDMSAVIELREKHREAFNKKYQIKLGFMSFFVKAAIEALKFIPEVNAEIRGESIVYRSYFDIGIAVGGGKGLVVPVLRNAERLSFAEIERAIHDFALRAEDGKLKPEELQGGTFTISNGGIYGSLLSTPIINPPQSGILGLHAIQDRPVVRQGTVVIRPMMYAALTYDHRVIDGREAVTFLKQIKNLVEDPARILLEV